MRASQERYDGKIKFIRINIDAPEAQPALTKYRVRGTPTIVLLDRQGRVASNVPGWAGDQPVDDALKALAAKP